MSVVEAALMYHAAGFSVIPIEKGTKKPAKGMKWKKYQREQASEEQLRTWFSTGQYDALSIVTGDISGGLVVLDFDGEDWDMAHKDFCRALPHIAKSRTVVTGSGKRHVWLKVHTLGGFTCKKYKRERCAIEVRANNHQTLAPPSLHPSGGTYHFVDPLAPIIEIENLDEIRGFLSGWEERGKLPNWAWNFLDEGANEPERDVTAFDTACQLRDAGYTEAEAVDFVAEGLRKSEPDRDPVRWAQEKVKSAYSRKPREPLGNTNSGPGYTLDGDISSVADLGQVLPNVSWLWDGWLPRGFVTVLAAEAGKGKSLFALRLCQSVIEGTSWPDGTPFTESHPVLWADTESSQAILLERVRDWKLDGSKIKLVAKDPTSDFQLNDAGFARLRNVVQRARIPLVVIDSLSGGHRLDENSTALITVMAGLAAVARDLNIAILVIHHLRKKAAFEPDEVSLDRLRGTTAIGQFPRVVMAIETPNPAKDALRVRVIKSNLAKTPEPLGMTIGEKAYPTFGGAPAEPVKESTKAQAMRFLRELLADGPLPATEIYQQGDEAGFSKDALKQAKKELGIEAKRIGGKTGYWQWRIQDGVEFSIPQG